MRRFMFKGTNFDPSARALFSRMSVQPSQVRKRHINRLIVQLKAAGVWSKLDALYLIAAHDAQAARLNWVQDAFNLTAVNAPTFTADRGYAGDGSTSYLDTGFSPNPDGVHFTLNSGSLAVWSRTNLDGADPGRIMGHTTPWSYIQARSNFFGASVNASVGGMISVNPGTGVGLFAVSRRGSADTEGYHNGTSVGTSATTPTSMPANSLLILAVRSGGGGAVSNHYAGEAAMGRIAAGLTDTEEADFYAAVNTYLTALGAA